MKLIFTSIGNLFKDGGQQIKKDFNATLGLFTGESKISFNYVCDSCDDFVMQCPVCKAILKYSHAIDCPNCGTTLI